MQERIGKIPVLFIPVYFTKLPEGETKMCHCRGFDDPDMRVKGFVCWSTNDSCLPIEVP